MRSLSLTKNVACFLFTVSNREGPFVPELRGDGYSGAPVGKMSYGWLLPRADSFCPRRGDKEDENT